MARRIWLAKYGENVYCCAGRPNTCNNLRLLQAEESEFHTSPLIAATDQVNEILARLRDQAPEGLHLALLDSTFGLVFKWVEPIERPESLDGFVRAESPEEQIRGVLGIRDEPAPPATT